MARNRNYSHSLEHSVTAFKQSTSGLLESLTENAQPTPGSRQPGDESGHSSAGSTQSIVEKPQTSEGFFVRSDAPDVCMAILFDSSHSNARIIQVFKQSKVVFDENRQVFQPFRPVFPEFIGVDGFFPSSPRCSAVKFPANPAPDHETT